MKEENFKLFREKVRIILKGIRNLGINYKVKQGPLIDNPSYYVTFKDSSLKRWKLGIWATGSWGNYYDIEGENEITIFMIHDWYFDKWRPSSADLSWYYLPESICFDDFLNDLKNLKKHPISSFGDIYYPNETKKQRLFLYLKEWYFNVISTPINYKLRNVWSVWVLFLTLRIISLFDKRVKKVKVFKEGENYYTTNYTFSFLATLTCGSNDESFYRFYRLYSYFPQWLKWKCRFKLFDATYNVSDYDWNMNEDQIRTRMFKGVYVEKPNKNEANN